MLADDGIDLVIGSHRDRRLDGDDGEAVHFRRNLARSVVDERQVGEAVAAP
jgi:hypothetical protein